MFKAFPLGDKSLEVMLRGLSKWHYADGTHAEANWAAYLSYVRDGETVKLKDYEIYMVSLSRSLAYYKFSCVVLDNFN